MADVIPGTLFYSKKGGPRVRFTTSNGRPAEYSVPRDEIDPSLARPAATEITVDLELGPGGSPRRVRPQGAAWPQTGAPTAAQLAGPQPQARRQTRAAARGDFRNPYNFIPPCERDDKVLAGPLGDHRPPGHERYHADRYSGKITVKLIAETPLLLLDPANAVPEREANGHQTFPVLQGPDGKPLIRPTSIKGMLRSAYEAVTNSRFGIFRAHEDRLGLRVPTGGSLALVPVRIERSGTGTLQAVLLTGTSNIGPDGRPADPFGGAAPLLYAAWVPGFGGGGARPAPPSLPPHGQQVECWLERWRRKRTVTDRRTGRSRVTTWEFWTWRAWTWGGTPLVPKPAPSPVPAYLDPDNHYCPTDAPLIKVTGWVCRSNRNIRNKHDERIFFIGAPGRSGTLPVTNAVEQQWAMLIKDYQEIHRDERRKGMTGPPALPGCLWSRHIEAGEVEQKLEDGMLCHARLEISGGGPAAIERLYPVMLSRDLFACAPADLLPRSLAPAPSIDCLSPADRVFGWVKDGADQTTSAYRGNLRIGPVVCETPADQAIASWGQETGNPRSVPLAILGQPKPSQTRFYLGEGPAAKPLAGRPKDQGYASGHRLRGRKVYPHHTGLAAEYWACPWKDRTKTADGQDRPQEYRRPCYQDPRTRQWVDRDTQNHSVTGWVNPATAFTFDLWFANLDEVELGALLWLLDLDRWEDIQDGRHFHRLGGGRPLGFGSVALSIAAAEIRTGAELADAYRTAFDDRPAAQSSLDPAGAVGAFKRMVETEYGGGMSFAEVSFIRAFLRAVRGFADGLPIHYPRLTANPAPEGENFKWFVENEQGRKVALDDLSSDAGLPHQPR
ncbi:MAG: TIGR03986 family type III CRISPR-associated RAMP protein [Stellaceae bacterium]